MERFTQRLGHQEPRTLQLQGMDDRLRNRIWNAICETTFNHFGTYTHETNFGKDVSNAIQSEFFGLPTDEIEYNTRKFQADIKTRYMSLEWYDVYSFLEFLALSPIQGTMQTSRMKVTFMVSSIKSRVEPALIEEKSAFRFIGNQLTPITNQTELAEIEQAVEQTQSETVSKHLGKAVSFYSNRENPDYPNAITESIKAVEEAARLLTGDKNATLGVAIKKLKTDGRVHSAFADGVNKLFGWTSDTMRHAAKDKAPDIGEAEARFMLINCSAMANYLLSLSEET
jgi:hypothetical protein